MCSPLSAKCMYEYQILRTFSMYSKNSKTESKRSNAKIANTRTGPNLLS